MRPPLSGSTFTRRSFLRLSLGSSLALGTGAIRQLGFAADSAASSGRDLLVHIFLRGGCDGLGLLAPVDDPDLRAARSLNLRMAESGEHAGLRLAKAYPGNDWRLHPSAAPLMDLYEHGELALIHAAGLKNATRSHFDAQNLMERGVAEQMGTRVGTGWLARLLEALPPGGLIPGLSPSGTLPASLLGTTRAAAITSLQDFSYYGDDRQAQALAALYGGPEVQRQAGHSFLGLMGEIGQKLPRKTDGSVAPYVPAKGVKYPDDDFSRALQTAAQLAKAEVGLQVAALDYGDWDTHTGQDGRLPSLIENLAKPLRAFYQDLSGLSQRTTIVIMSEFGRRLKSNESGGTDHGHGNVMMVLGRGIKGGRCVGTWPGLAHDRLDQHADLAITTDYREVLTELLRKRLRVSDTSTIFPGYEGGTDLGLA